MPRSPAVIVVVSIIIIAATTANSFDTMPIRSDIIAAPRCYRSIRLRGRDDSAAPPLSSAARNPHTIMMSYFQKLETVRRSLATIDRDALAFRYALLFRRRQTEIPP